MMRPRWSIGAGNRTLAGAIASVVDRRITSATMKIAIRPSVSENPQPIPVLSSSAAKGSWKLNARRPANRTLKNIRAAPQSPSPIRAQVIPAIRATIAELMPISMQTPSIAPGCDGTRVVVSGRDGVRRCARRSLHDPEQLVDRRPPLDDLAQSVLLEVDHAVLAGL